MSSGHQNLPWPNQDVAFRKLKFQQLPQTEASEICSLHSHPLGEQWAAAVPRSGTRWPIQTPSPICDAEYWAGRHWAPFFFIALDMAQRGTESTTFQSQGGGYTARLPLSQKKRKKKLYIYIYVKKQRTKGGESVDAVLLEIKISICWEFAASECNGCISLCDPPSWSPSFRGNTAPSSFCGQSHLTQWAYNITSGTTSLLVLHDPSSSHWQFGGQGVKAFYSPCNMFFF